MSQAMRCDRCKGYFDKKELGVKQAASFSYTVFDESSTIENGYQYKVSGHIDLCPECTKKLFDWVGIDPDNDEFTKISVDMNSDPVDPFSIWKDMGDSKGATNKNPSVTRKRAEKWSWT